MAFGRLGVGSPVFGHPWRRCNGLLAQVGFLVGDRRHWKPPIDDLRRRLTVRTCATEVRHPRQPGGFPPPNLVSPSANQEAKSTGQPGGQVHQPIRWSSPPANQEVKSTSQSGGQVHQPIRRPSPPANQVTKSVGQPSGQVRPPTRWRYPLRT